MKRTEVEVGGIYVLEVNAIEGAAGDESYYVRRRWNIEPCGMISYAKVRILDMNTEMTYTTQRREYDYDNPGGDERTIKNGITVEVIGEVRGAKVKNVSALTVREIRSAKSLTKTWDDHVAEQEEAAERRKASEAKEELRAQVFDNAIDALHAFGIHARREYRTIDIPENELAFLVEMLIGSGALRAEDFEAARAQRAERRAEYDRISKNGNVGRWDIRRRAERMGKVHGKDYTNERGDPLKADHDE